jgi:hypothetical protein
MKHCCKELAGLFERAREFGCRVQDSGVKVIIFPPDRKVQPYIAHKSERAFHEVRRYLKRCGFSV